MTFMLETVWTQANPFSRLSRTLLGHFFFYVLMLYFANTTMAVEGESQTQWFYHGFKFPKQYTEARLANAPNWKEEATRFCLGRIFRAAHDIQEHLQKTHYFGGKISQGNIAVRIDNIGKKHIDLYLYCNMDASIYIAVGHYTGDLKDPAWDAAYRVVYDEFKPDAKLESVE